MAQVSNFLLLRPRPSTNQSGKQLSHFTHKNVTPAYPLCRWASHRLPTAHCPLAAKHPNQRSDPSSEGETKPQEKPLSNRKHFSNERWNRSEKKCVGFFFWGTARGGGLVRKTWPNPRRVGAKYRKNTLRNFSTPGKPWQGRKINPKNLTEVDRKQSR